jgi:hypothetical protein
MTDEEVHGVIDGMLDRAIMSAAPLFLHYRWPVVDVTLSMHRASDTLFILLHQPDGPILAVSPESDAADRVLWASVPDAQPWEMSGATAWANTQRWDTLALRRVELIEVANDADNN